MTIIKIEQNENGAHENQTIIYPQPILPCHIQDGWAIVPDDMPIPDTFPFVDITVEGEDPPVVTSMTAGVVPSEPEPGPDPPTTEEHLAVLTAAAKSYALTAVNIPDTQALEMVMLFPTWEDVLSSGAELAAGRIISNDGQLYRVVQSVIPQAHQMPGGEGMLAIYRPIDREHAGTVDDPIPWVYGMDCLAGVYYSYNGAIYRVADGGNMIPCVWPPDSGIWQWVKIKEVS